MAGYRKTRARLAHSLSTVFICMLRDGFWNLHRWASSLSLVALNPHSSEAKLTAEDWPCPFGLFSRNGSVLTDALAEERKRGATIVSKEPCFINVNTVTGQNDQSPSSIHNYYSTQRKRDIKGRGEGERVQTGAVRWTALGKWGSIKFVISNTPPRSLQTTVLPCSSPSLSPSVPSWPNCLCLFISCSNPVSHPPISAVFKSLSIHKAD